jgi:hypothetical protein
MRAVSENSATRRLHARGSAKRVSARTRIRFPRHAARRRAALVGARRAERFAAGHARRNGPVLATAKIGLLVLARQLSRIQADDAGARWRWARDLLAVYEAGQNSRAGGLTQGTIALRLGQAVGRHRPFCVAWVSHVLAAARAWPRPPLTAAERSTFLRALHGHAGRKGRKALDRAARRRGALGRVRRAARDALKFGCLPEEVRGMVEEVLSSAEGSCKVGNKLGCGRRAKRF